MTDERDKVLKRDPRKEDEDVEAHAHLKANDEKGADDEADTSDVEAHAMPKQHQK